MTRFFHIGLVLALTTFPHGGFAQSTSEGSEYSSEMEGPEEGEGGADAPTGAVGHAPVSVQSVVPAVEGASVLCNISGGYAVDCMAERYENMARELGDSRLNAEAREILEDTAAKLRSVALRNQSATLPPARLKTADGTLRTSRPIVAVAEDRQAAAAAEAVQIIAEAQTMLLRSAESSNRQVYAQIASAMESNKVLLRSS